MTTKILVGDCRETLRTLPTESVHCVVTSPPYWGLRDYGLPPLVWGGSAGCEHEWGSELPHTKGTGGHSPKQDSNKGSWQEGETTNGSFCRRCGAWRGSLGLEPTPELYVQHMVEVFREVRRVMRDDATLWLNLGDSYASTGRSDRKESPGVGAKQAMKAPGRTLKWKAGGGSNFSWSIPSFGTQLKPKDLCGIPWRLAFALQADGWWLRSDIIWHKCLSGGARVYAKTQKGEMPMTIKDMVRLDPATVKLWDGEKWNWAVGWEQVERKDDELEIELRNGERVGCSRNHRWPLEGLGLLVEAQDLRVGQVIKSSGLPSPAEPRTPFGLPADQIGWFVGLYIAEGSLSGDTIQIASHLNESGRFAILQDLAERYDGHIFKCQTSEQGMTININSPVLLGILKAYVSGNTAKQKHLHIRCWKRPNRFLKFVLDGYLSGDGHWDESLARWRLGFCQNDNLANDLRTMCARLGYSLRLKRCQHKLYDRAFPGWRGSLYIDASRRKAKDTEIVAIRKSRARKFWHIMLQDEPHLFALASGVLTGNSNPMPESVKDRPTKAHEYLFLLSKSKRYFYDADAVREGSQVHHRKAGGYDNDRGIGDGAGGRDGRRALGFKNRDVTTVGRNRRTVWRLPTQPFKGAHFATFPEALVEPCIKAGTSERGCCPSCGKPWERVVEKPGKWDGPRDREGKYAGGEADHGGKDFPGQKWQDWRNEHPDKTTGWRPTCGCGTYTCATCNTVVEYRNSKGEVYHNGEGLAQESTSNTCVSGMREGLYCGGVEGEGPSILQSHMLGTLDDEARQEKEGLVQKQSRLYLGIPAHSSDGEQGGLCDAAPPCDEQTDRPLIDQGRSSPPQKRKDGRQSVGESGTKDKGAARQNAKESKRTGHHMPRLRQGDYRSLDCPSCGEETTQSPFEPAPAVVLDCFGGSGTVGVVAERLGRDAILCELNPEYAEMSRKRIKDDAPMFNQVEIE